MTVVGNLVDNALDAVAGQLQRRVSVRIETTIEEGTDVLRVTVADSGPGLTPDQAAHAALPDAIGHRAEVEDDHVADSVLGQQPVHLAQLGEGVLGPLVADEPGGRVEDLAPAPLAPMPVEEIFQIVKRLNEEQKLTVLLVEQNATLALAIAEHGYVMENGRIVLDGTADALRENADIQEF